jgi:transposase InsO family protein
MHTEDVTDTLELALTASGCDSASVLHKPKLLSDNGTSYIAAELAEWINASHVRGAPLHPQTQGKIERWHQTLKNRILLENYFLPGDLERPIETFLKSPEADTPLKRYAFCAKSSDGQFLASSKPAQGQRIFKRWQTNALWQPLVGLEPTRAKPETFKISCVESSPSGSLMQ